MFNEPVDKWGLQRALIYKTNNGSFIYTIPIDQIHRRQRIWKTYAYDMFDTLDLDEDQLFEVKKASLERVKQAFEQEAREWRRRLDNEYITED